MPPKPALTLDPRRLDALARIVDTKTAAVRTLNDRRHELREKLIAFTCALRLALAHHRRHAYATRGRKPVPVKRSTFMGRLPAARQALGEEISTIFADAATRVADLPAVHEWDVAARDRVAAALRTASSRRHGRRADG